MRLAALLLALLAATPPLLVLSALVTPMDGETLSDWRHVQEFLLPGYLKTTTLLSLGVACVTLVLGASTAWLTSRWRFFGSRFLRFALLLPLAVPAYVDASAYGLLFDAAGPVQAWLSMHFPTFFPLPPIRSLGGAIFVLGVAFSPYVYLLASAGFSSLPNSALQAASSLGATRIRAFFQVALPATRPFLAAGVALALMETLADYGTVSLFGVPALTHGIYRSWFYLQEPLIAARLSAFLLVAACLVLWLEEAARRHVRYAQGGAALRQHEAETLHGWRAVLAFCWCFLPVFFGFLLPAAWLCHLSFFTAGSTQWAHAFSSAGISLKLAGLGVLFTVFAALAVSLGMQHGSRLVALLAGAAQTGYAVPGAVMAIGILLMLTSVDKGLRGAGAPLILTGTLAGLMLAYLARFFAVARQPIAAGLKRLAPEMEQASLSLGRSHGYYTRRVVLPALFPAIAAAAILVSVDIVKELPATLILRPFGLQPLAITVYQYASDDRVYEAAPHALLLIALSTLAMLALHRLFTRQERIAA